MSTFISVGNAKQPFTRLLNAVADIISTLPQPVYIQHGHTPVNNCAAEQVSFLRMEEFTSKIKQAELVILHAGAGSVINAIQMNKVPVIMPRRMEYGEHVNDHQVELALTLAKTKKVVIAENSEELKQAVLKAIKLQDLDQPRSISDHDTEPHIVSLVRDVLVGYAREIK